MIIRKTTTQDFPLVMEMYINARKFMAEHNNPSQWGNNKPGEDIIKDDIQNGHSYVLEEDGKLLATFCYMKGPDPTYSFIEDGYWLNDDPYFVVHRITSSGEVKGSASYCINECLKKSGNLRIDTHKDNYVMQNLLKKLGFTYCGIIYIEDGSKRLAYQKVL